MTVDSFGRIRWLTSIDDLGSHSATLTVSDPRGGKAVQPIVFNVDLTTRRPGNRDSSQHDRAFELTRCVCPVQLTPNYPTSGQGLRSR